MFKNLGFLVFANKKNIIKLFFMAGEDFRFACLSSSRKDIPRSLSSQKFYAALNSFCGNKFIIFRNLQPLKLDIFSHILNILYYNSLVE